MRGSESQLRLEIALGAEEEDEQEQEVPAKRMKVAVKEERILGERGVEEGLTEEEEELEDPNSSENDEDRPVRIIRLGTEEVKKYAILG